MVDYRAFQTLGVISTYLGICIAIFPEVTILSAILLAIAALTVGIVIGVIRLLELFDSIRLKYINRQRVSMLLSILEKEARNQKFEVVDYRTTLKGERNDDNYQISVKNGKITILSLGKS